MKFSLAGVLVSLLTVYILLTQKKEEKKLIALFSLNLIFEGFINVGYWGIISGMTLKVSDFLQFIMAAISFAIFLRKGIPLKTLFFTLCIVMSVVIVSVRPYSEPIRAFDALDKNEKLYDVMHYVTLDVQCIKTSLRLICFAWNSSAVYLCITENEWSNLREKYFRAGRYIIVYGWIEFMLGNLLGLDGVLRSVIQTVFQGSASQAFRRNGIYAVVGLTGEPSQFTMIMFSYWLVYLIGSEWKNQTQATRWLTMSSLLLMVLSGSFRIVGMFPILLFMYMTISGKARKNIIIVGSILVAIMLFSAVGVFNYYIDRLGNAMLFLRTLDDTVMTGGEAGRLNTVVEAFEVWLKRPLFGIGPGQTFAYGFIPSVLATTGLMGALSWYGLIFGKIGGIRMSDVRTRREQFIVLLFSFAWVYTDSIAIGYSIYVLAMALELRRVITKKRLSI